MQTLSISSLETGSQKDPIWVLNSSATSDVGQPGEVNIGIPKLNGSKVDLLHIPQTWLPQDVTQQIPRDQLLGCSEFRQAVGKGLLTIITPEEAARLLKEEGAEEEQKRLDEFKKHLRNSGAARNLSGARAEINVITPGGDEQETIHSPSSEEAPGLSTQFILFAERLKDMKDVEALNALRNRHRFTRRELVYLKANLPEKPTTNAAIQKQLGSKPAKK